MSNKSDESNTPNQCSTADQNSGKILSLAHLTTVIKENESTKKCNGSENSNQSSTADKSPSKNVSFADLTTSIIKNESTVTSNEPHESEALDRSSATDKKPARPVSLSDLATLIKEENELPLKRVKSVGDLKAVFTVKEKFMQTVKSAREKRDEENGLTPLMLACRDNKFNIVEKLLDLGASVSDTDKDGRTALYHAVSNSSETIVKALLNAKADPNITAGEFSRNCLHQACSRISGAIEIVRALIKAMGKDSKLIPDLAGNLPVHIAASARNALVMKELFQSHASEQVKAVNKEYRDTPLHVAARGKDVEIVKIMVDNGASVDQRNNEGQTPLHIACTEGDESTVKFFSTVKANPNIYDKLSRTPLHVATECGHLGIIEILIDKFKADVNQRSKDGSTLIHLASKCGHPDVALFFVKRGVPLQMPNKEGAICLHEAAKQGHVSVVKNLLTKGASVNVMTKDCFTPLHTAVRHGKHLVVQVLLGFGADVNSKGGKERECPLHLAARLSKEAEHVSEMLLKSGANVNAATEDGETALHIATRQGNYDLVKMLLDENANILARSKIGEMPLHVAVQNSHVAIALELVDVIHQRCTKEQAISALNTRNEAGDTCLHYVGLLRRNTSDGRSIDLDLARLLLDHSADSSVVNLKARESVLHYCSRGGNKEALELILTNMSSEVAMKSVNYQNKDGWSPLLIAVKEGNYDILAILLQYHARVDIFDEVGKTAIHVAAEYGHLKVAELLMKQKAYVNAKTKVGLTPIHLASENGHTQLLEMLVTEHGGSVDIVSLSKKTPLHLAAERGRLECCDKLLQLRADPNAVDSAGRTPLHVAAENDHSGVVRLFLNHSPSLIYQANKEGNTCVHIAANKGSMEVMKALVHSDKGVVNIRNKKTHASPMHLAAAGGHFELMMMLLDNGGSLEDEDKEGMTPLHLCGRYGYGKLIDMLKAKVPLTLSSEKNGMTVLHVASEYGQAEVVQDLLQRVPGSIESERPQGKSDDTEFGFTPLHLAARNGHEAIVRLLLNSHGVRVDAATEKQALIPLHLALISGHTSIVSLLLARSTHQLNIKDNQGRTGLHLAAAHGHLDIVTLLLGQGAELNVIENDGWTPLHFAADAGHLKVVKYLVRMGATTTIEDKNGKTPLAFAAKNHHLSVMKYLVMRNFNVENMLMDKKFLSHLMLCSKLNENSSIQDFILNSPAPIYTACKLARLYRQESAREKDKAQDFLNMGDYCEELGHDLLHLSTTFNRDEVLNAVDEARQPLLDIMIDGELKDCVAHQNVQSYLTEVWKGDVSIFVGWKSILLFFVCLFIPPIWAIFCLPFHRYSHLPTLKFICNIVSHLYLVALLTLVAAVPWDRSYSIIFPNPYEWLLLIFLSGILLSQITEPQSSGGLGSLPLVVLVLSTIAICVHITAIFFDGRTQEEIMYGRDQILGCCLLLCVVQFMEFLSLHHLFGPWSIIIRSLIQDLLRFLVILFIFIIGFVLHLFVVYKPVYGLSTKSEFPTTVAKVPFREGVLDLLEQLFFAMFGLVGLSDIKQIDSNTNPPATKYIALIVFALYEIITIIVLINLLIAMMSNTYTRLEERSDIEWKFGRAKLIRNMTKSRSTPVPLNILTTVLVMCKIIAKTHCCCCRADVHKICDEMENKLPENVQMESFVSDRSAIIEEGSGGPKRLEAVVNWHDVVRRYIENKGFTNDSDDDDDDDDHTEDGGNSRMSKIKGEMRSRSTIIRRTSRSQSHRGGAPNGHVA